MLTSYGLEMDSDTLDTRLLAVDGFNGCNLITQKIPEAVEDLIELKMQPSGPSPLTPTPVFFMNIVAFATNV